MKDLQVKDLKNYISTSNPTRFYMDDTGENFVAKIAHFETHMDFYVTSIFVKGNELCLKLKAEI